ncbi:MAG: cytochrome C [Nitrosomonadales bacterium]|nr:MAG: cytochrome C [Nitrosomonadales bacterium]
MATKRLFAGLLAGVFASGIAGAAEPGGVPKIGLEERLGAVMQDAAAMQAAIKAGRKVTTFCANCHGEGGNSGKPDVPNLAGQNTAYLLEQVKKFADGRRRNEFMQGLIKALSDEEKVNAVVYFSAQEVKPHASSNPALANHGKELFFKICQRCHGEQGRGNEKIPRIAGQQPEYLTLSLKRYRDGSGERMDPFMAANTKNLKDADISALVAFVSGMK